MAEIETMNWPVVDYSGKEIGEVSLDKFVFGLSEEEQNAYAVQAAVKTYLANRRQATAKTKNRSEVSGSGKKLWKQKGTGRARMGNIRSPLWRHGGVVFGPRGNQNYKLKLNKKVNDLAVRSALSDKALNKELIVLTKAPFESNKTKDFAKALEAINGGEKKTLIVLGDLDANLILAARNLHNVKLTDASDMSVYDIVDAQSLIILENAFLLHRYEEEKELRSTNEEAMVSAICKTMTSISASSLTTIAGFLALCAMRLTLGRDIGLVMAKGVALGVICTVVVLPALILTFDKWVEKYKHRTVIPRLTKLSYFVSKHAAPIVAIFLVLLVPFAVAQNKTEVYYTLFDSLPQDLTGIVGTNKLGEDFGMTTSHFILVHDDLTATQVSDLCDELKDIDGITQVVSLDSITGPGFDTSLLPDSVTEILQSGGYKLILANSSYKTGTDAINAQVDEMNAAIKAVDPEGVMTGEGAMTKDLIEVADVDFKNVNVWSIMAVAVIILISFRSLSIPVLLVASIEAAIAINMGIPYFTGTQLPFIASIVIGTIQLGATVDYSILMTTRYHEERAYGRTPQEAAQQSLEHCSQSILTSGLTFFAATVGVAAISKMELLQSICLLISRGALISMAVILVVLPAALMLLDWIIRHTTMHWLVPEYANAKKSEKE